MDADKGKLSASIAKGEAEKHGFYERHSGEPPEFKCRPPRGVSFNNVFQVVLNCASFSEQFINSSDFR